MIPHGDGTTLFVKKAFTCDFLLNLNLMDGVKFFESYFARD